MLDQTFSKKSLEFSFKKSDFEPNRPEDVTQFKELVLSECEEILAYWNPPSFLKGFNNGREVYKMDSLAHTLILRNITSILRKVYNIKLSPRDTIIRELLPLLENPAPYQVIRLDISSFYESVDCRKLLGEIKANTRVGSLTSDLISKYLIAMHKATGSKGLMPGSHLSAILSEISLIKFDEGIRRMEDVILYHRFVDDIIIVTCSKEFRQKEFINNIKTLLPFSNMKLNGKKQEVLNLNKFGQKGTFSYLGYQFQICGRDINIQVENKKIKKIKRKLYFSIKHFNKKTAGVSDKAVIKRELDFFIDSVKVLASSGTLKKKNLSLAVGNKISYKFTTCEGESLNELDVFLHSLPFSKAKSQLGRINQTITSSGLHSFFRSELLKISFVNYFKKSVYIQLPREKMKVIWRVWKYA